MEFRVQCDHSTAHDRAYKSFSKAESYALSIPEKSPVIWSGDNVLAAIRYDANGKAWSDLTFEGCKYA